MKKLILILISSFPLLTYSQIDFTINGIKHTVSGNIIQEDKRRQDYLMVNNDSIIYSVVYWSKKDSANPYIYELDRISMAIKDCNKVKEASVAQYGMDDDKFFLAALFFKSNVVTGELFREGSKAYKMKHNEVVLIFTLKEEADNFVAKYFKIDD